MKALTALLLLTTTAAFGQLVPQNNPVRLDTQSASQQQANGTKLFVPPALKKPSRFNPQLLSLQRQLATQGYSTPMNGVMNAQTRSAILQYQTAHSLPQTGKLDAATSNALNQQ